MTHSKYGNGFVAGYSDNLVEIDFTGHVHKFKFPSCFAGFVKAENEEVQQKLDWYIKNN